MILAAFLICVVAIVIFFTQKSPSRPDFRISNVHGKIQGPPRMESFYLIFDIENNGTAAAHNVNGTAKYEKKGQWRTADWRLWKVENVLEVGERYRQCFATFDVYNSLSPPSKEFVITMSCDEGVLREFNVTIP